MGRRVALDGIDSQVRARRASAGLSQQELADRCGLTRQTISAIEAGRYVPNTAVALRLARALGCAVEDLFQLPGTTTRVAGALVGDGPAAMPGDETPVRVQLARVGERLLARRLGGAGALAAADGVLVPRGARRAREAGRAVEVDLLVDPRLIENTVVVLGCDPALALLGAHMSRRYPWLRLAWVQAGSLAALRGLAGGEAHVAGMHLRDPDSGEYNLPYIRRELAGRRVQVVTLAQWQQGLVVARGNPRGIQGPADLARPDLRLVNREPGSGGRALLDAHLQAAGIDGSQVRGYDREVRTHLAVAEAVAGDMADTGPAIRAVANAYGLDFIPLQEERHDLVIPAEYLDTPPVQALLEIAVSPAYRQEVEVLGGYDSSRAGTVVLSC